MNLVWAAKATSDTSVCQAVALQWVPEQLHCISGVSCIFWYIWSWSSCRNQSPGCFLSTLAFCCSCLGQQELGGFKCSWEFSLSALSCAKLVMMLRVFFLHCIPGLVLLTTDWFPTSSNVCMKLDDLMCAAFECRGWKTKPVERSVCHARKCNKHFLEVSQKISFWTNKGTSKSSAGLGSENSCKNRGGPGLWWALSPSREGGQFPCSCGWVSQITNNLSSNQSSANIWKPKFHIVRLKEDRRESEGCWGLQALTKAGDLVQLDEKQSSVDRPEWKGWEQTVETAWKLNSFWGGCWGFWNSSGQKRNQVCRYLNSLWVKSCCPRALEMASLALSLLSGLLHSPTQLLPVSVPRWAFSLGVTSSL